MPLHERNILDQPTGYRSATVGLFMAQLDDQHALLREDIEGIAVEELEWQPRPGANSIGMLLAHIAIVEVFWTQVGPERRAAFDTTQALGIGMDDDGMPAPPDGGHPEVLRGKPLEFYLDLLARARAYACRAAASITDEELGREFTRTRRNGTVDQINLRWVLYHMLEHFAGHYGQILLLRHLHR